MSGRYLHDNGDCWMGCVYCQWEDERDQATTDNTEDEAGDTE